MTVLVRLFAGLLIWSAAFAAVYALQGLGCAQGWQRVSVGPVDALRAALVVVWLAFLGGALLWARRSATRGADPDGDRIVPRLERGIAVTGAVAIAYTLFPVAWASTCT